MGNIDMEQMIQKFGTLTEKPVKYLSVQSDIQHDIKTLVKSLYDYTKSQEKVDKSSKKQALPEIIVDDFDEEQIWQQIELQNSECWDQFVWDVANCISNKNELLFPVHISEDVDNDSADNNQSAADIQVTKKKSKSKDGGKKSKQSAQEIKKLSKTKGSIVDDQFFKLKDMEKFLINEEKMEGKEGKSKDSDEESIDMFEDMDDESEEEDGNIMYSEFFQGYEESREDDQGDSDENNDDNIDDEDDDHADKEPDSLLEVEHTKEKKNGRKEKKVRFAKPSDDDTDDSEEELTSNNNLNNANESKSEFEERQQRLKQQISRLEEKTLKEAPWQLKGEVDASRRPQNSLLEEVVDFDLTSRPPPIITEQTTLTLEDIVKQRIKDKAWDDVTRKEKPVDDQLVFKKPEVLDHSKSKQSLAQVYEAEYLKQKQGLSGETDEKEPESHTEVRNAMNKLFAQLDALCHYHYTPKPPQAEVKIVTNTPAISMEEVAPLGTSDAALLAPEEVKKKLKGDLMSKEERTQTDKNRERRKKKLLQRKKGKVLKVTEQRNTKKGAEASDKSLKTSKAFFQQLNDDSSSLIKSKNKRHVKNKGQ